MSRFEEYYLLARDHFYRYYDLREIDFSAASDHYKAAEYFAELAAKYYVSGRDYPHYSDTVH